MLRPLKPLYQIFLESLQSANIKSVINFIVFSRDIQIYSLLKLDKETKD